MKAPGPVDDNVRSVVIESGGASDGARCVQHAELVETVEDRTILADIESLQLPRVVAHVVGADDLQEVDVVVTVEPRHGGWADETGAIHVHLLVEAVVHH